MIEPINVDGLWETYHHISKLDQLQSDERGNVWSQLTFGAPIARKLSDDAGRFVPPDQLCNTAMCFAGWYAVLNGFKINQKGEVKWQRRSGAMSVESFVVDHAGITLPQATSLFCVTNSLEAIACKLTQITGEDRR